MIEPNPDNIYPLLTALADGELSAEDADRLTRYLSCHPELTQWLRDQRRLTDAAARALRTPPALAPQALRRRVLQMARGDGTGAAPATTRVFHRGVLVRQALAASVLLTVGLLAGRYGPRGPSPIPHVAPAQTPVIPASIVSHVALLHADCSRLDDARHAAPFPAGELSADVKRDLSSDKPYPDLAPLGFRYVGAGPCGHALEGTLHLLYRTTRPDSRAAVSVFVQPFAGQYALDAGTVYSLAAAQSPFPTLAWRTDKVVYFLVADDEATERQALALIRNVPKP